jgi:hypothetical protein
MLHPKSVFDTAITVTSLMEDLWDKRSFIQNKSHFVFRIEATNHESSTNVAVFAHFLITDDRWYFLLSDSKFGITYDRLTEYLTDEYAYSIRRASSYRHYAFSDLVCGFIGEELEEKITEKIRGIVSQFTIWDTFPILRVWQ